MPPKKNPETPEEQAKRFRKEARKLVKNGELDPAEADAALDKLVRTNARRPD
jgi:polyhydroxyalkanoate synthesis regulator phasin